MQLRILKQKKLRKIIEEYRNSSMCKNIKNKVLKARNSSNAKNQRWIKEKGNQKRSVNYKRIS